MTDEWTKYARYLNVDLYKIIDLISLRSTHSNIMKPGIGVGGYCLQKDPNFMTISNKYIFNQKLFEFPLTQKTLKINNHMYLNSLKVILSLLPKNKNILFAGVTYKENVDDVRNSPSVKLIQKLNKYYKVSIYDPMIEKLNNINNRINGDNVLKKKYDGVIIGVLHRPFKKNDFLNRLIKYNKNILIFDLNNFFKDSFIKNKNLKKINLIS